MALSDKPGVLGTIGTIGQAATQSVKQEVKCTIENSAEQLGMKEKKEGAPSAPDAAVVAHAEAMKKQQSQEVTNWLYGSSSETPPPPPAPEKKPEAAIADVKAQLGLESKPTNTANAVEQLGLGGNAPQNSASLTEQLGLGASQLTPEQQQLRNRLHQDYYQRIRQDYHQTLNNPKLQSDTEERQKEAQEEQETPQQRMERQMQEDLQKKQEEEEKKKQIDPGVEMAHNMEKNRGSSG